MKKLQSLGTIAGFSVAMVFALTQPAKAILVNTFEFTDEGGFGTGRVPGEKVTGTITFDGLNPGDSATGVAANSVVVDSIPSWLDSTWGDATEMQVGVDVVQFINGEPGIFLRSEQNSFDIVSGIIQAGSSNFVSVNGDEALWLNSQFNESAVIDTVEVVALDVDSSSLTFSAASVPFEFSPTLGLFLVGSVFGVSRYAKSRKAARLIDN